MNTETQDALTNELINKVRHLYKAIIEAENMILILEKENNRLKDVLISLASENNQDYVLDSEAFNESVCSI